MSDPTAPPFTQGAMPELQFDADGRAWLRYPGGTWSLVPQAQPSQQTGNEVNGNLVGPAQSEVQPAPYTAMTPSTSSRAPPYPPPIDPGLIPLPENGDHDLLNPAVIAQSRGLLPAAKVAGVRQKTKDSKQKKRHYSSDSDVDSEEERPRKRGRRKGTPNYKPEEVSKLLDIVEKILPLGQKGWKEVAHKYQKWAKGAKRPERDQKALESKYKLILKTKKPTGDAYCPPDIKRAHRIEGLINERAGTREISDSDIDGAVPDASSDSDIVEVLGNAPAVHNAVTHRAPSPPLRRTRMNAPELVNKLSQAFDPAALKSRDEDRAHRSFQATQIFTISQQLRDVQAANETLRNQMAVLQNQVHEAERCRDRAELRLEMVQSGNGLGDIERPRRPTIRYQDHPDLVRVNGKIRSPSDESDKENEDPSSPSSHARSLRSLSPFKLHHHHRHLSTSSAPAPSGADHATAGPSTLLNDVPVMGRAQ